MSPEARAHARCIAFIRSHAEDIRGAAIWALDGPQIRGDLAGDPSPACPLSAIARGGPLGCGATPDGLYALRVLPANCGLTPEDVDLIISAADGTDLRTLDIREALLEATGIPPADWGWP